ncbi:TPA_asm: hypothetical protein GNC68_003501, partial [Salmonella enterica subsp. salamae serovar 18:z10:z6]|nr:hypothetical protein [Salmonella enterica subsp. salamae serovar 18:z10:z6]
FSLSLCGLSLFVHYFKAFCKDAEHRKKRCRRPLFFSIILIKRCFL